MLEVGTGPDFAPNTWVSSPPSKYSAVNECGGDLWSFRRQKAASWIKLSDLNWQDHQVHLRTAPPVLSMWPRNSISHIQD